VVESRARSDGLERLESELSDDRDDQASHNVN